MWKLGWGGGTDKMYVVRLLTKCPSARVKLSRNIDFGQ